MAYCRLLLSNKKSREQQKKEEKKHDCAFVAAALIPSWKRNAFFLFFCMPLERHEEDAA